MAPVEEESTDRGDETPPSGLLAVWASLQRFARTLWRAVTLGALSVPAAIAGTYFFAALQLTEDAAYRESLFKLARWTMETGGCTLIKLGQWMSHREDFFPAGLCDELRKLRDDSPAHSLAETRRVVKKALGSDVEIEDVFDSFGERPIASGSVGQVHKAVLKASRSPTGQPLAVAVKVLHPGVSETLRTDLQLVSMLSQVLSAVPGLAALRPPVDVDEFSDILRRQVDLRHEAYNLARFAANFEHENAGVVFPRPIDGLVTADLLVETWEEGESIQSFVDRRSPANRRLASMGYHIFMTMLCRHNFFHSDCHAGNILVRMERPDLDGNFVAGGPSLRHHPGLHLEQAVALHHQVDSAREITASAAQRAQPVAEAGSQRTDLEERAGPARVDAGAVAEGQHAEAVPAARDAPSAVVAALEEDEETPIAEATEETLAKLVELVHGVIPEPPLPSGEEVDEAVKEVLDEAIDFTHTDGDGSAGYSLGSLAFRMVHNRLQNQLSTIPVYAGGLVRRLELVLQDARLALRPRIKMVVLDAGLVTSMTEQARRELRQLLWFVFTVDGRGAADQFVSLSLEPCADVSLFRNEMEALFRRLAGPERQQRVVNIGQLITGMLVLVQQHHMRLESDFASVVVALGLLEGLARDLDPEIDVLSKLGPYVSGDILEAGKEAVTKVVAGIGSFVLGSLASGVPAGAATAKPAAESMTPQSGAAAMARPQDP